MADDFWFFLSYARIELNVHIKRFQRELAVLVRSLGGVPQQDDQKIGFLDINNLEHGRDWTADLSSALGTSRVMAPLYSPSYFQREYCGKEYQVFLNPSVAYEVGSAPAVTRAILPVLLFPVSDNELPADPAIRNLQMFDSRYPEIYKQKGLHFLMDTPGYEAEYKTFLRALAEKIVTEARKVPALGTTGSRLKRLENIPAAFPAMGAVTRVAAAGQAQGPDLEEDLRLVRFICVAAKRGEVQRAVNAYGTAGGIDWKPFAPDDPVTSARIAQQAALNENFVSDVKALDQSLPAHLREAEAGRLIVIVLVDPWSLTNKSYRDWLAPCDQLKPTCAIIVAWNSQDSETKTQKPVLMSFLRSALPNVAVAIRHPVFFREKVDTREQLQAEIQSTLAELYMRLLEARSAKLGLTAQPPPSVSNAQEATIRG